MKPNLGAPNSTRWDVAIAIEWHIDVRIHNWSTLRPFLSNLSSGHVYKWRRLKRLENENLKTVEREMDEEKIGSLQATVEVFDGNKAENMIPLAYNIKITLMYKY